MGVCGILGCVCGQDLLVFRRRLVFHEDLYTSILLGAINIPLSNCIVPINSPTVYIVSTAASCVKAWVNVASYPGPTQLSAACSTSKSSPPPPSQSPLSKLGLISIPSIYHNRPTCNDWELYSVLNNHNYLNFSFGHDILQTIAAYIHNSA